MAEGEVGSGTLTLDGLHACIDDLYKRRPVRWYAESEWVSRNKVLVLGANGAFPERCVGTRETMNELFRLTEGQYIWKNIKSYPATEEFREMLLLPFREHHQLEDTPEGT